MSVLGPTSPNQTAQLAEVKPYFELGARDALLSMPNCPLCAGISISISISNSLVSVSPVRQRWCCAFVQ
jgi:hypothetical protein